MRMWWCLESITGRGAPNTCCQKIWWQKPSRAASERLKWREAAYKWFSSARLCLCLWICSVFIRLQTDSQNGCWCTRERETESISSLMLGSSAFFLKHIRHEPVMLKTTWRRGREREQIWIIITACKYYSRTLRERDQCVVLLGGEEKESYWLTAV